ncbi:MAG: histidine kinase, partial [Bacteroidota bacterium]
MMTIKEKYIRLIGIPLVAFVIPFVAGSEDYWASARFSFTYTLIYWQGSWMIIRWMRKRYPRYEQTPKRLTSQVTIITLFITITTPLCLIFFEEAKTLENFAKGWIISMTASFVVISIYESAYFFHKWRETKLETEKLKREHIQSQFETLKNQVNPHFLFNSLNTLTAIILENPNLAVEF